MPETPRFTLQEEPHGTGGFAKVIRGRDNILDRDIAVKVLDPLATEFSESDQERFRREARTLARLSHPSQPLRRSLEQAAHEARGEAHEVLRTEVVKFFGDTDFEDKENWFLQSVRNVVQTLLANPSCVAGATELVVTLKKVNQVQRARSQSSSRTFWTASSDS